jgi:hypothetical protein
VHGLNAFTRERKNRWRETGVAMLAPEDDVRPGLQVTSKPLTLALTLLSTTD